MQYLCLLFVKPEAKLDIVEPEELSRYVMIFCPIKADQTERESVTRVFKENGFKILPCDSLIISEGEEFTTIEVLVRPATDSVRETVEFESLDEHWELLIQLFPLVYIWGSGTYDERFSKFKVRDYDVTSIKGLIAANPDLPLLHSTLRIGAMFERLLKSGANVDARAVNRYTPLHFAIQAGNAKCVRLLIQTGANINAETSEKYTALHFAIKSQNAEFIRLLLKKGANVNAETVQLYTPLHFAIQTGNAEFVPLLLGKGAEVNAKTVEGYTPLHFAVQTGNAAFVQLLLDKGAEVNAKTLKGCTPFHFAIQNKKAELGHLLLDKGAEANVKTVDGYTPLHFAVQTGNAKLVQLLLDKGAEVNAETVERSTPLYFAIESKNAEFVRSLLKKGANANAVATLDGSTPLHLAVKLYHSDNAVRIVQHLLQFGANVFAKNDENCTPLHHATKNPQILKMLLKKGVSVDVETSTGRTLLLDAVSFQEFQSAEYIINLGPNPNLPANRKAFSQVLARYSDERNGKKLADMMLRQGFTVSATEVGRCDVIKGAIRKGMIDVVRQLLDFDIHGWSSDALKKALEEALRFKQENIIKLLLEHEICVDFHCVKYVSINCLQILFGEKAIDAADPDFWRTALLENGKLDVIELFLERGSDPNLKLHNLRICGGMADAMKIATVRVRCPKLIDLLVKFGGVLNAFDLFEYRDDHAGNLLHRFPFPESISASDRQTVVKYVSDYGLRHHTMLRHVVKMEAICPEINVPVPEPVRLVKNKCKMEIKETKETIGETRVTFYDILTKNVHQIARYARNEDVVNAMEPISIMKRFPVYSENLNCRFRIGLEHNNMVDEASSALKRLFSKIAAVPDDVIQMIIQYLSNRDLIILQKYFFLQKFAQKLS